MSKAENESSPTTGSGSIYRYRTKAGVRYRFVYRDSAGRQSTARGFTSKAAARRAREELMGRVHRGQVRVSRETFGGYWRAWLPRRRAFLQAGSWEDYRRHGELRLLPHLGDTRLTTMTPVLLTDWLIELAEFGTWAPKTLNNALTALVVCLNQAVSDGLLPSNPAAYVQRLPLGHVERDYLRRNEITRYLDACSTTYRPLAATLIGTGARISEALSLRIPDVDVDRGVVLIHRSAKDGGTIGATKGRRFRRVEIGPILGRTLQTQIARQAEHTIGDPYTTLLFTMPIRRNKRSHGRWPSNQRHELDRNTVSRNWHKAALTDAGLRNMPLHSLRHTAGAAWLATGHPLMRSP